MTCPIRCCIGALLFSSAVVAEQDIQVEALLPGFAVLQIDGSRVTLRAGQSHAGIKLISADARAALIEIEGRSQSLGVSQRISTEFTPPEKREVSVARDAQLQYRMSAELNGVRMPVIVDTGANIVAMSSTHARTLGISADEGTVMQVQTAGSVVAARRVTLDTVDVGGLRVTSVDATVLEGEFPDVVLLGMSYLKHVELEERGGVLTLRARW
jgi:aspartyl protease family protein